MVGRTSGVMSAVRLCVIVVMAVLATLFTQNILRMDKVEEVGVRIRGPLAAGHPGVVALIKTHFLNPPSVLPYNLIKDPIYTHIKHEGSWDFIRENVAKVLNGQREGFFVEAGALDGERGSNTLWLEQDLGWTGLLVEPNPASYHKLVNKHRKAWTSNTCLSPEPFPMESVLVSVGMKKLFSFKALQNVLTTRGASYLLGSTLGTNAFDYVFDYSDKSYYVTQCFPLGSYLLALNVATVDFLSLDIQGVEKQVLQNVPWDSVTIRVLAVEIANPDNYELEFESFMKSKGYRLEARGEIDYIFVKEDDQRLNISKVEKLEKLE
ncbi:protein Star [Procambarus clarkii]|uniref:protein Star n=1 Tax=Procambarus clarkii TaxID=6728 RepID=UPI001E672EC5|nr:uncharacterized protein LOC123770305 [Procambarus clarkii]